MQPRLHFAFCLFALGAEFLRLRLLLLMLMLLKQQRRMPKSSQAFETFGCMKRLVSCSNAASLCQNFTVFNPLLQLRGMGHLQLPVLMPGIRGWPRSGGGEDERLHPHALMQLHDLLPAATHGQWPLCASMQTRSPPICALEANSGHHHPGTLLTREIYRR